MNATSTFIAPQKALIEILIQPDQSAQSVVPAYFSIATNAAMLNRPLLSLETFIDMDVPNSPFNPGVKVMTGAQMDGLFLTLLREPANGVPGGDFYRNVPLSMFHRCINGAYFAPSAPDRWICEPTCISWSDSFVMTGTPFTFMLGPISVLFLATFLLPEQDPAAYRAIKTKNSI